MLKEENSDMKGAKPIRKNSKEQTKDVKAKKKKNKIERTNSDPNNTSLKKTTLGSNFESIERQLLLTFNDETIEYKYIKTETALYSFLKNICDPKNDIYNNTKEQYITKINIEPRIHKKPTDPLQDEKENDIDNFVLQKINEALIKYNLQRDRIKDLRQTAIDKKEEKPNSSFSNEKEIKRRTKFKPKNAHIKRNLSQELLPNIVANDNKYRTQQPRIETKIDELNNIAESDKDVLLELKNYSLHQPKIEINKRYPLYIDKPGMCCWKNQMVEQTQRKKSDKPYGLLKFKLFDLTLFICSIYILFYLGNQFGFVYPQNSHFLKMILLSFFAFLHAMLYYLDFAKNRTLYFLYVGRLAYIGLLLLFEYLMLDPDVLNFKGSLPMVITSINFS